MASKTLHQDDIAFGRALLLATDALGMSAEGAFWIADDADGSEWRYFLVTSLLDVMGPRDIYLQLNVPLARKLSEREARSFNFFIAGPLEPIVNAISAHVATDHHHSDPREIEMEFDGRRVRLVVYRMASELNPTEIKSVRRRFKAETNRLRAA